jgi:hypothetical protein
VEQSPSWESNSHSASQEIPCHSLYPKVRYSVHKNVSPVPVLSQMYPVRSFPPCFPEVNSIIIVFTETAFKCELITGLNRRSSVYQRSLKGNCFPSLKMKSPCWLCVHMWPSFQLLNQLTDFHQIWYERFAVWRSLSLAPPPQVINNSMAGIRTYEVRATLALHDVRSWSCVWQ